MSGYLDAGIGVYALGNGDGTFKIVPPRESGFCVMTDAKSIREIKIANRRKWIVASNQEPLMWFGEAEKNMVIHSLAKGRHDPTMGPPSPEHLVFAEQLERLYALWR